MSRQIRAMGHAMTAWLVREERLKPTGIFKNIRRCNCKVCGVSCEKDQAFKWSIFTQSNEQEGNFLHRTHLCLMCNAYWSAYCGYEHNADLMDQYKKHFKLVLSDF